MSQLKDETLKLIKIHLDELFRMNDEIGGVHIARVNGCVAVIGIENFQKKTIFQTDFISGVENKLLDAQILVQDLLEEEGVEALSEFDLNLALGDSGRKS